MDIARTRKAAGLTQVQLIDGYTGRIDKYLLSKIEAGYVEPTESFLRHVFRRCGFLYTDSGERLEKPVATPLHDEIYNILINHHVGKENAITRDKLKAYFGVKDDRVIREIIADLQTYDGVAIVNNSDGAGYYIADSYAEIERYKAQERSRIESGIMKTLLWGR